MTTKTYTKKELTTYINKFIKFVEAIPDKKLNMNYYLLDNAGCALYHARVAKDRKKKNPWPLSVDLACIKRVGGSYMDYLFATSNDLSNDYHEPTGKPAKKEFKRRAKLIIAAL